MNEFDRALKHIVKGDRYNELSAELLTEAKKFLVAGDGTNESNDIAQEEYTRLLAKHDKLYAKAQKHFDKARALLLVANDSL